MLATEQIARLIPNSNKKPITRKQLVARSGFPDRYVRRCIAELRLNGLIIINTQDGRGYYKSHRKADLEQQLRITNAKAMKLLVQCKFLRKALKEKKQ